MRRLSDPVRRLGTFCDAAVAEAADRGDHIRAELLADARDEDFDRVRIAVEILIVDMLDELGPADHLALVVHEI